MLDAQYLRNPLNGGRFVTDPEREVMRRALGDPPFQKSTNIGLEIPARVRVAGRRDRTAYALTFRHNKLELSVHADRQTQHRDRALLDLEFNTGPGTRFTVVLRQAAQDRLALGDVNVVRAVVSH